MSLHKKLYATTDPGLKYYGLPKVHKTGTPFRQIIGFASIVGQDSLDNHVSVTKITRKWLVGVFVYLFKLIIAQIFIQTFKYLLSTEEFP